MTSEATARAFEFRAADDHAIAPGDWEARAAQVRQALADDGLESSMAEALGSFRFVDDGGRTWTYDGAAWQAWDGTRWTAAAPPASLRLQPFTLEALPDAAEEPPVGVTTLDGSSEPLPTAAEIAEAAVEPPTASIVAGGVAPDTAPPPPAAIRAPASPPPLVMPSQADAPPLAAQPVPAPVTVPAGPAAPPPAPTAAYRPTHVVPAGGLPAWSRPDPAIAPDHRLDAGLDVMVAESFANGWARIVCSNTWTAWVDGRLLIPAGQRRNVAPSPAPPSSGAPAPRAREGGPLTPRSEIGLAALLGFVAWLLAVFVAPVGLRFAMLGNPLAVGVAVALLVLAVKWLAGPRVLDARTVVLFLVDGAVATVVLYLFSPA